MPDFLDGSIHSPAMVPRGSLFPPRPMNAGLEGSCAVPLEGLPQQDGKGWAGSLSGSPGGRDVRSMSPGLIEAKWRRAAQHLWQARKHLIETPQWLQGNRPRRECFDEEAEVSMHYGLTLEVESARSGFDQVVQCRPPLSPSHCEMPVRSRSEDSAGVASPGTSMGNAAHASLLTFPVAPVAAVVKHRAPVSRAADRPANRSDDVLVPFRSPARQAITVFSLIGGTGRTSIAASLARMLAGSGLRVLLVDTCAHSLLPRLFGAGEARRGVIRNFLPVSGDRAQRISLVSLAVDAFAGDEGEQYRILHEFTQETTRFDRVVWDLGGAPLDWATKVLSVSPQVLVPLLPNANSLVQLRATERFLNQARVEGTCLQWRYVLNHFDERDALHVDMRGRFRQMLGDQMLRGALRSSPLVDEALAKGRTIVDHAPGSPLVSDLWRMARQLNQFDAGCVASPATVCEWVEQ